MTEARSAGKSVGSPDEPYPKPAESVGQLILDRVGSSGPDEAFRAPNSDGDWQSYSWQQTYDLAADAAAGLIALGLEPEQRVGISSNTRFEWILGDYAVMLAGGATTTVYPATGAVDTAYILGDSDSRMLIAEDQTQADKVMEKQADLPNLKTIILIDGDGNGDNILSWNDLVEKGQELLKDSPSAVEDRVAAETSDSLATVIYTSGTTGKPKGVELTHGNWTYEGAAMSAIGVIDGDDVQFLWLPLAHSMGKVMLCVHLQTGSVLAVDGSIPKIITNLPLIKPTLMAAVPRIFEKVYAGVHDKVAAEGGMKKKIFDWAFEVGAKAHEKRLAGENVGSRLSIELSIADKMVFSQVREGMGGRMKYFVSGSAALSADISTWFQIVGMPVLEGYGLTETSAATTTNRPDNIGIGTIGVPFPGTEVKIAKDGEMLIRGPGVMRGYRNRPDANEEVFGVEEGWFATGDIGEIDSDGRVKITDRKKDLVKTSGGKYIAPSAIEAQFKAHSGLVGAVVIIANNRKFASAVVALDADSTRAWAKAHGLEDTSVEALYKNPDLIAAIQTGVDEMNSELNHWETIKKFVVLPSELSVEGGELTPSLKVKRKVVEDRYAGLIAGMYS